MKQTPNIQNYLDFRAFLTAYISQRRKTRGWSYGVWARRLGIKTPSTITKVILGTRAPGPKLVKSFCRYFDFNADESAYFEKLVQLEKTCARDPELLAAAVGKLPKTHQEGMLSLMDVDSFALISEWYHLPILHMAELPDFEADPKWIQSRLVEKVSTEEIQDALTRLFRLGMLQVGEDKRVMKSKARFKTKCQIPSENVKRYHEKMIEQARASVRRFSVDQRETRSSVLGVRTENLPKAKALIQEFHDRFAELIEEGNPNQIYQFQTQLFPLTQTSQPQSGQEHT